MRISPSIPDLTFNSRRSPVIARRGIVSASQPLAAQAGLSILMQGGNAADAAVATAAALNVTEPTSTGIGGDCFALFYDAKTRAVTALNGSGRAPAGLSLDLVARQGIREMPPYHPHTITVPGAAAGWCDLVARHGRLRMAQVLEPAIRLAEEGYPVAPITAHHWQGGAERQLINSRGGRELTIDGRGPQAGEIMRLPTLARTLWAVAEGGQEAFYHGPLAKQIAETVQAHGGVMTEQDLAAHTSTWDEPIRTSYRGVNVWECPPNGQGLAALIALNILEGIDLAALPPLGPERLHWQIEAMRLAFADSAWHVADPSFHDGYARLLAGLASKPYAAERRKLIDPARARLDTQPGQPGPIGSDTVYLSAVDGEGNACSFINSLYMGFGTGIVPEGTGICLQNRGHLFSLDPAHPNALAPGKRPYHTIIPAMATGADGSLYASFGVMGGFMQPQGHMQVIVNLIDDHLDPQAALDQPRFCIEGGTVGGPVLIEEGVAPETLRELARRGHDVQPLSGHDRGAVGRGQVILRDSETGVLWAGSDPRADGQAMGF